MRRDSLRTIHEISVEIALAESLREILEIHEYEVCSFFGADLAGMYVIDQEGAILQQTGLSSRKDLRESKKKVLQKHIKNHPYVKEWRNNKCLPTTMTMSQVLKKYPDFKQSDFYTDYINACQWRPDQEVVFSGTPHFAAHGAMAIGVSREHRGFTKEEMTQLSIIGSFIDNWWKDYSENLHTLDLLDNPDFCFEATPKLTKQERRILILISKGLTYTEITHFLRCKAKTLEKHTTSIFDKLGIDNRAHAIALMNHIWKETADLHVRSS